MGSVRNVLDLLNQPQQAPRSQRQLGGPSRSGHAAPARPLRGRGFGLGSLAAQARPRAKSQVGRCWECSGPSQGRP